MKKLLLTLILASTLSLGAVWGHAGVAATTPFNSPQPPSPLPPPTQVYQCKRGGWRNLARHDGTRFKNERDCIQYVKTGK